MKLAKRTIPSIGVQPRTLDTTAAGLYMSRSAERQDGAAHGYHRQTYPARLQAPEAVLRAKAMHYQGSRERIRQRLAEIGTTTMYTVLTPSAAIQRSAMQITFLMALARKPTSFA